MNTPVEQNASAAQIKQSYGNVHEVLTAIVSDLCEVEPAQIGPDFVLSSGRLRSSLGRATLDAKIRRRLGVKVENLHALRTFGQLEGALSSDQAPMAAIGQSFPIALPSTLAETDQPQKILRPVTEVLDGSGLSCGIDVEAISALPDAKDYWDDAFYRSNFTSVEIAYCISKPSPKMHFAGGWCAKEAFKKCLPAYLTVEMNKIEVTHTAAGLPLIQVFDSKGSTKPHVALSLTHNEEWAIAVVVSLPNPVQAVPAIATKSPDGRFSFTLSLIAFILSLLALVTTLLHHRN
jgi:phosphopantetheine--protein transferase-like protein